MSSRMCAKTSMWGLRIGIVSFAMCSLVSVVVAGALRPRARSKEELFGKPLERAVSHAFSADKKSDTDQELRFSEASSKSLMALKSKLTEEAYSLSSCKVCQYMMAEFKITKGEFPEAICEIIFKKAGQDLAGVAYEECQEIATAAAVDHSNVKKWVNMGCVKMDGPSLDRIVPCPSVAMCAQLSGLNKKTFCDPPRETESGSDDACKACKWVVARVRQGYGEENTLDNICIEMANKGFKNLQPYCEMVLHSFTKWGKKFKGWLEDGCVQSEKDGEEEKINPCPTQKICHQIHDLGDKPYCKEGEG
jgi:hypothetical protein